jgi:hypothetical protein
MDFFYVKECMVSLCNIIKNIRIHGTAAETTKLKEERRIRHEPEEQKGMPQQQNRG